MNEEASPSGPSTSRSVRVDAGVVRVYERGEDDARTLVTEVFTAALADAAVAEAFVREARALAALAHPRVPRAVVTVLGEGKVADAARVSQPIPPGAKLLDEETARGRRYSAVDLEALFRDAMTTLDELHRLLPPLVHGNVHPGALVVTRGSDVSFVDFDLGTRAIARRPEPHGYEAPELSRGAAATGAADVYGVALVVACLAAGVGPARLPRDARGRFVVAGGLSPRLSAAVAACLDPTPARRPTAAGALQVLTRGPSLLLRARRSSVRPVFALALGATLVAAPLAVRATKRTPPPAPASAFVVAGTHWRAHISNHWCCAGLPKMLGSQNVSTCRVGHAHSRTWSSVAEPARKLSGSSSTSGISCTAPSPIPSTAIVSSQPPSFAIRPATMRVRGSSHIASTATCRRIDHPATNSRIKLYAPATSSV
jgi:hypothetical protein